jgi:zinc and cadmium transporter
VSRKKGLLQTLIGFAAGVMLATAFLDLLPEAVEYGPNLKDVFLYALLGVVAFFFLERTFIWFHHHDHDHKHQETKPTTGLIIIGDGIHNLIDGLAIAAAFVTSPAVGIATTAAIALHELPLEIADFSVLLHSGLKRGKALLYNLSSAMTAVVGGVLGYLFLSNLEKYLFIFLAFTSGMFIYIASSDLIPDIHKHLDRKKGAWQLIPFMLGILTIFLLTNFRHE